MDEVTYDRASVDHLVDRSWSWERVPRRADRVLPTGRGQIVIDLDAGRATFVGPRTTSAVVVPPMRAIGCTLSGVGTYVLAGAQAAELVDTAVGLEQLVPGIERDVPDCVSQNAVSGFLTSLVERVTPTRAPVAVVEVERAIRSGASATNVISELGLDRRSVVPEFRRIVGLGPKQYERITRFQRAIKRLRSQGGDHSIADIAAELGYADHAHLCRDVRHFAGWSPMQLKELGPGPDNHVPYG